MKKLIFMCFLIFLIGCNNNPKNYSQDNQDELYARWLQQNYISCGICQSIILKESAYYGPHYKSGYEYLCRNCFLNQAPKDIKISEKVIEKHQDMINKLKSEIIRARRDAK